MFKSRAYLKEATHILLFVCFSVFGINEAESQSIEILNGTTGTPLGGFGAGALKFNANTGTFAIITRPPADAYDFKEVPGAHLEFFSQRGTSIKAKEIMRAEVKNGRPDDDAIWPLHKVNFGNTNGVQVEMTGFSPFDNVDYNAMSLPYALYEFKLQNTENVAVKAGIALEWTDSEFKNLPGLGISSASRSIVASSKNASILITTGSLNDQSFLSTGKCDNNVQGNGSKVAALVNLKARETATIRLVVAWYDTTDPEIAHYFNLADNAGTVAKAGLKNFDRLKNNAEGLVNRFRSSSLPSWLKNQTLNTLANLSTNSMYKKDGRVAFAEGQWTCFGTMDQMWHARQIIGQMLPFFAWQEMRYWARTQMKNGQIHHDMNEMAAAPGKGNAEKRSVLVSWDDTEHRDYRDVQKWVDLNCAFIISSYELYQMTGDKKEFEFLWPYLKKAAQRILDQVELYGSKEYPYTFEKSENSYDAGGDPDPFNANLSAVTYKVMVNLAKEKKDANLAEKYQKAYDKVVKSFADRYLAKDVYKFGKHSESFFGGQWLALHLKLGELWSAEQTDYVLQQLNNYYHPYYRGLGNEKGTYDEWTPYILAHYGGLLLNTARTEQWFVMQKDAYERQYFDRDKVFDHPLNILPKVSTPKWIASNIGSGKQYISLPVLWRNYYDIAGFHRDKRTQELWLQPKILAEFNNELKDVLLFTPEGNVTLSLNSSGELHQNKNIRLSSDKKMKVSTLYLQDNFGQNVSVAINGKRFPITRSGTGYAKELLVKWNGVIDNKGIEISVDGDPGKVRPQLPAAPPKEAEVVVSTGPKFANQIIEAESAEKSAGVTIEKRDTGTGLITSCNNFDYVHFSNIDFGRDGLNKFYARVESAEKGAEIEIVLDNVAGELLGKCTIPDTGIDSWQTISTAIKKIKGVHDVILRFSGSGSNNLMNVDKITFGLDREDADPFKK